VRIVVPYAAGGNTDGIARLIAQPLAASFGQPFVVDNKPGANGVIAAELVAKAPPDGYTLFMATVSQLGIAPALGAVPFDPVADYAPISLVATNPFVLTVHRSVPAASLAELVAYVAERPGQLNYASGGNGSVAHLTGALFFYRAGLSVEHVAYRGGAPALADVLSGQVPMLFANLSEALPHAASAEVRLLALSGATRAKQLPDLPTIAESGYPGFRSLTWNGLVGPAHLPPALVERISEVVIRATGDPHWSAAFAGLGVDPQGSTPAEFAATIRADLPVWAEAVRISGAHVD
jgi:tripartite-type tricarboxylate transporter receptor subunit TctC